MTLSSDILNDALVNVRCAPAQAEHFVLCNGDQMRYIISLNGGTKHLVRSVAAYGGKLALLLRLLPYVPFRLLQILRLGYYSRAELKQPLADMIPSDHDWNMLIGTYDTKQKLVIQCFNRGAKDCTYIKVGNAATEEELNAEISFLRDAPQEGKLLGLPKLISYKLRRDGYPLNIMQTQEFHGHKAAPLLTPEICSLWREIAEIRQENRNGVIYEFSHGDFTPWNLRVSGERYIVFDWEHCGMHPYGYDILYWAVVTRLACCGMLFEEAYEKSIADLNTRGISLTMTKEQFYHLFTEVITPDGF